jgi:mandelamide amidase
MIPIGSHLAHLTPGEKKMYNKHLSIRAAGMFAATIFVAQAVHADHHSNDFTNLTATGAASDFCAGKVTSEALVSNALSRAKALADLNAFVTLDERGAIAAAKQADAARKNSSRCRPLEGVPIVIKDNIEVAGLPNTAGTKALLKYIPKNDAPVVAKLRAAGAIIIGKTNMHELAFGVSGFNPSFSSSSLVGVRNAYDNTKIAGGSSSGTGAAVGARIAPAGLGTDTGGSVRVPCALNGCASLRPTVGRYSQVGIAPISRTRDTAGPMAVSMVDVELLDRVITGDSTIRPAALKNLRLGVYAPTLANLDADTKAAFEMALQKMKGAGISIVDVDIPGLAELNGQIGFPVALYEAYDDMVSYLQKTGSGITIADVAKEISSPDVKGTYDGLVIPRKLPGPDNTLFDAKPAYDAAMSTARPALINLYQSTFSKNKIDALIFPTVTKVAMDATPDSSGLGNFLAYIQNTDPSSNAGIPGLQIPITLGTACRLPVGLELDGPAGSDRKLISIGLALENLFGRLPAPANR